MSDKFTRMARSLPSLYKAELNVMIRGLLKAWAVGDEEVEINIEAAKDQLFVETASGKYLNALGSNVGVDRSSELGLDDDTFRKLIPVISLYPKQVRQTLVSLLDVFWGPGFTRPNINSGNVETFNFGVAPLIGGTVNFINGSNIVKGTGTQFTLEVNAGDYIKPALASGLQYSKVSAVLSDTELELSMPWSYEISLNVDVAVGIIRELEYSLDQGEIQSIIRFIPNAFIDLTAVTVTELVEFINNNNEHNQYLTASTFVDPLGGNRLNLRTNTAGLRGAIQILGGDANTPARLNFDLDLHTETKAAVYEVSPNEVVIKIPSSVPVLRRSLKGSIHPRQTKTEIFSNKEVFNFSSLGASSTLELLVDGTAFVVNFNHSLDFANPATVTAYEVAQHINSQLLVLEAFSYSHSSFNQAGLRTTHGSMEYQVTGGTANTILGFTTDLQTDPDLILSDMPSSYVFDPVGQLFTVTSIRSELSQQIDSGSIRSYITISDASSFPNKAGKLLLNFGRSAQEGPINYTSRPNNSTLLIDASYTFINEHTVGSMVNYIVNQPSIPRVTGDDYAVYITGTEEARTAAQALIRKLLAAGVVIRFLIEFPEFYFTCIIKEAPDSLYLANYKGSLTNSSPLTF